jgi:hypothetical protein
MGHSRRENKKYGGSIGQQRDFVQSVLLVIQIEMILCVRIVGHFYSK